jgi:hypothetical protein
MFAVRVNLPQIQLVLFPHSHTTDQCFAEVRETPVEK